MEAQIFGVIAVLLGVTFNQVFALNYELGKTYRYNYATQLEISEGQESMLGAVGVHLSTQADVAVVWQNTQNDQDILLQITLHDTRLFNATKREDNENTYLSQSPILQAVSSHPIFAHWNSGKVSNLFASSADTTSSLNVKKGVASLLQVQTSDGKATEVDGSGECTVSYTNQDNIIRKTKDLSSCRKPASSEEFSHHKAIIGVTIQSDSQTTFELSDDKSIIQSATSTENYRTYVNIRHDLSSAVKSSQSLTFVSSEDGAKTIQGDSVEGAVASAGGEFINEDLENDPVEQQCTEECKSAAEVVAGVRDALTFENLSKMKSASAYLQVLEAFRGSSQETIQEILNDDANGDILPQLLDVAGATQTQAAFDAAMSILDFKNEELERTLERFLVVVAYSNHPSQDVFTFLWELLKDDGTANENVKMTLALTLGMMINTNCATEDKCQTQSVQDALSWFYDGLKSESAETRILCLQALKNAVQPASIAAITGLLDAEEDMTVIEVGLEALEKFKPEYFTSQVNRVLNTLYHQSRRPVSIVVQKLAVTSILGKNPSEQDVVNVVLSIPHQARLELAKYVISKVLQMTEKDSQAGETVRRALRNQAVGNYYNLGQDGFSTAYKNILADTVNAMVDFDINILFTGAGLLRQSNFDVLMHAAGESMMVLQVRLMNAMVDYDINILFTGAGLLRQSNFDVLMHAAGESMMVLQVRLMNAMVDFDINILFTGAGLLRQSNFDVLMHAAGESMMVLQVRLMNAMVDFDINILFTGAGLLRQSNFDVLMHAAGESMMVLQVRLMNAMVDYDINILFTGAGLLRQSNFDVLMHAAGESMMVLQVRLMNAMSNFDVLMHGAGLLRQSNFDVLMHAAGESMMVLQVRLMNAMVDFDINILFTGAGLLRQSNFDVLMHAAGESMMVLQVAGYSKGLEYFFGEETGGDDEAGAGLGVQLLDMQLRPLNMVAGTSDLMSMAWNLGSASGSSYPALQGIMLLHDHVQKISLQSGFDVDFTLHGGASVDLGGSLDFSLWDRTSTTIVYNSGAVAIKGSTKVVTPFLRTGLDFHAEASGVINFITDVQFSTLPPMFCLQMMQEPLKYRNHVNVYEQLTRSVNKYEAKAVRQTKIKDLSFKLMDENSPNCHEMFGKEEEEDSGWW
ncbi:microsomal triglyceride transfer protein large subunit-like [Amphiura filiformis]|uniref:microsomal triglyceride transfer protein large subunit-like n=1 Tax=Amphiura filiformis TaxID=82378 RepID=UPI003B221D1F